MKCIIPGVHIKVFGRAIHSLSKIGDELYFEPLEHGLALRTVNSSRSAYACFLFSPSFFQDYDDGISDISSQNSDEDALRCKIGMKSCLTVFKSMATIEKTVERCKIKMNMQEARLIFQLHCKHGIVKTHNLAFIECETLQAVFSKDMCINKLTAHPKLLSEAVLNFQSNQEEITLIASPERISLKNYVDEEPDPNKVMHTMLNLDPSEFDSCQVGVDTEITFCLKELRAILSFGEATGMPISIQFETSGRPVVLCIDSDSAFEANFVLATLADQQPSQSGGASQHAPSSRTVPKKQRSKAKPSGRVSSMSQRGQSVSANGDSNANEVSGKNDRQRQRTEKQNRSERLEMAYVELMDGDFDDEMINDETDMTLKSHKQWHSESADQHSGGKGVESPVPCTSRITIPVQISKGSQESVGSPVIPNQSTAKVFDTSAPNITVNEDEEEDEEDDLVPGTPPRKKFRSLFFGSSQASTQSQSVLQTSAVLAEDTDDDD
ncbi:cell cycle checkpoint control protein RAD9A-like [Mizuhopecten yessoensis]|uniref:cell cycle checkpoint control protein RAD9A-like n=1 Tax=Mizuhopecten yessoensis TaxID=6573 RepID=UPI000B45C49C|nr:cell cycle checkpoint control protein RAD9A-like [Mizuhopecten yessoensis]